MDPHNRSFDEDEISIKEIADVLWRGKWLIVTITLLFATAAGIAAFLTPKKYKSSVIISPVSDAPESQLGGLSSLASQFGGLASLAGISVTGNSKRSESLAVLQSEALTEKYIRDNDLLPVLFADGWDPVNKKWQDTNPENLPTLWKANVFFKGEVRAVASDTKTGLITLTITWKDPKLAAQWANDLVRMTNEFMRNKAIEQSERNISYLDEQANKTETVGVKQAVYAIMQNEINKVMLAKGSDEYAFKVIDPAVPPEKASSPLKRIWVLVGAVTGLFISALVVLIRSSQNTRSN